MNDMLKTVEAAVRMGECLRIVLSAPRDSGKHVPEKVTMRPVELRTGPRYQVSLQQGRQERHENVTAQEAVRRVVAAFPEHYRNCHLFTINADYAAQASRGGRVRMQHLPPTLTRQTTAHNRSKQYLIPDNEPCPFLVEIGVMTPAGKVRAAHYAKFRQINRFLELVEDVVADLPAEGTLNVIDFGCGKSYLTFAIHHLLTVIHQRNVNILGFDREPSVIARCRDVTQRLGLDGLRFEVGDILSHALPDVVDLSVSLHACDTATDAALARAIQRQAGIILAVPCCQHELAPRIHNEVLAPLESHGILRERFAALATDALRAQMLEICGYRTQVVEFIDMEHTAKNVLIRAVRRQESDRRARELPGNHPAVESAAIDAYRRLKEFLGLGEIALERALREADIAQLRDFS